MFLIAYKNPCIYTETYAAFLDISIEPFLVLLFSTGRKEDETDEKWIEKERERARKEREREERGKEAQVLMFSFLHNATLHGHVRLQTQRPRPAPPRFKSANR